MLLKFGYNLQTVIQYLFLKYHQHSYNIHQELNILNYFTKLF